MSWCGRCSLPHLHAMRPPSLACRLTGEAFFATTARSSRSGLALGDMNDKPVQSFAHLDLTGETRGRTHVVGDLAGDGAEHRVVPPLVAAELGPQAGMVGAALVARSLIS